MYAAISLFAEQIMCMPGGVFMRLMELKSVIVDDVCIYRESSSEKYEDMYTGKLSQAPEQLLNSEVRVMGANGRKHLLEIEIVGS